MIEFKNALVRIRCMECKEEHFIEMKHIGTDKEQRNMGFEYEHIFRGELKCSNCGEDMRIISTIYEYPKGIINYIETNNESCLEMDEITGDSLNIIDNNS